MTRKQLVSVVALNVAFLCLCVGSSIAASLDNIQFIKIAPQDAKAVMKRAYGKLVVIKPGDAMAEGVTVKEISAGRIVLEEMTEKGPETVIVRLENGRQRIERLQKLPEKAPVIFAPARNDK